MIRKRMRSLRAISAALLWLAAVPAGAEDEVRVESVPLKGPTLRYEVEPRVPGKTDPIEVRVPDSAPAVETPKPVEVENTPPRRGSDIELDTRPDAPPTGAGVGSDGELVDDGRGRGNRGTVARRMGSYEYCGRGCGGKVKPFQREQGKWYVKCKDNTKRCKKNCDECSCHLFKSARGSSEREHHGPGNEAGKVRLPDAELNKDWYCYCVES